MLLSSGAFLASVSCRKIALAERGEAEQAPSSTQTDTPATRQGVQSRGRREWGAARGGGGGAFGIRESKVKQNVKRWQLMRLVGRERLDERDLQQGTRARWSLLLRRFRHKDILRFKASLGHTVRSHLKNKTKKATTASCPLDNASEYLRSPVLLQGLTLTDSCSPAELFTTVNSPFSPLPPMLLCVLSMTCWNSAFWSPQEMGIPGTKWNR